MNQIRVYLDNVFAAIPDSPEAREMKRNILESMEDAYQELREEGKSKNEALGQVISQFGSVEEIREALGLEQTPAGAAGASAADFSAGLSPDLMEEYMLFRQRYGWLVALGVALAVLGVAVFLFLEGVLGGDVATGLLCLFWAAAAAILVSVSVQKASWTKLEKSWNHSQGQEGEAFSSSASAQQSKQRKKDKKRIKKKAENLSGVIMLAATLIFFVGGFCFGKWGVVWVAFPIGGVLCGLLEELLGLFEK